MDIIGEKIRKIRKSRKLTQEQFGNLLGVNKRTVISWEKGESFPHKDRLKQIATLEEMSVRELLCQNSLEQYSTNELLEGLKKRVLKMTTYRSRHTKIN